MKHLQEKVYTVDERAISWMARRGPTMLRVSMGLIFLWFGALKFFPNLSPAEDLAGRTISTLTFGVIPSSLLIVFLAVWECLIGLGFMTGRFMRATLMLLFFQMTGTFVPLVLFSTEMFTRFPYAPTLEGQYIIKNIALISAGLVIGAGLSPLRRPKIEPES
jgi:uncharacterized membrane protein YphA (DoxX/SURF4 family)